MPIATAGFDIAKNVFYAHGVDAAGVVVLYRRLRRGEALRFFAGLLRCSIGLEFCVTALNRLRGR
jgi:transposase